MVDPEAVSEAGLVAVPVATAVGMEKVSTAEARWVE